MREHELAEPHDSGVVTALVEVELAQQLPDLQRVFERCAKKTATRSKCTRGTEKAKPK